MTKLVSDRMISFTGDPIHKPSGIPKRIHAGGFCVFCILILSLYHVFTSGSTLHNCFLALRSVFPPDVRISIATLAYVGGRRFQLGGLVHENKDFCGRESKIVASVHEMCRLGGHDGQFEVSALEKGHSD